MLLRFQCVILYGWISSILGDAFQFSMTCLYNTMDGKYRQPQSLPLINLMVYAIYYWLVTRVLVTYDKFIIIQMNQHQQRHTYCCIILGVLGVFVVVLISIFSLLNPWNGIG